MNTPLRVFLDVFDNPCELLAEQEEQYDANTTASKIAKMTDLVGTRYNNLRQSLTTRMDKTASYYTHLKAKEYKINNTLAVEILLTAIEIPMMKAIVAIIKALAENDIT